MDNKQFADSLRDRRRAAGLSQSQFALKLGVNFMTVSRWERGVTLPSQPTRLAIDAILGREPREAAR